VTAVGDILRNLLDHAGDGGTLPELLCQDACRQLPVEHAGICVMNEAGTIELTVGSDATAVQLEELQLTMGEGPCMDAFESSRIALYPDIGIAGAERWPAYAGGAAEMGVRAMFSFPLRIGGIRFGVLDLFRSEPGSLTEDELTTALHYVDAAVLILLHLQAVGTLGDGEPATGLETPYEIAFQGHAELHQATGMVAVQAGVGLASALVLLRARAFASNRSLADVALDVVQRRLDFR